MRGREYFAFLLSGVMFGLSMVPTMVAVWLGRNAGNANYLYNMTLVVNVALEVRFSSLRLGLRVPHAVAVGESWLAAAEETAPAVLLPSSGAGYRGPGFKSSVLSKH